MNLAEWLADSLAVKSIFLKRGLKFYKSNKVESVFQDAILMTKKFSEFWSYEILVESKQAKVQSWADEDFHTWQV